MTDLLQALLSLALSSAQDYYASITSSPRQIVAHCAALVGVVLVSVAAFVRTMTPLRWLAVGSNVGLLIFGALHPSVPTLMVSGALLPINLWRAVEMMRITHRVRRASADADLAAIWLKPYMRPLRLRAGKVLFRKGDRADRLFLLTSGELELVEVGARLQPGRIFGEIALFSPEHVRTSTVRCVTRCVVLSIHESTVRQLYFQNPAFGFHLIELLAARLSTDVGRVERKLEESEQRQEEYISRSHYGMPLMPASGVPPASADSTAPTPVPSPAAPPTPPAPRD